MAKSLAVNVVFAVQPLTEAAQYLREDNAGVAASSHQRAPRALFGDQARGRLLQIGNVFGSRPHSQTHIGSGIAIGNREDIEGVDCFAMLFQPGMPGQYGLFQVLTVEHTGMFGALVCQTRKEISHNRCGSLAASFALRLIDLECTGSCTVRDTRTP